MQSDSSMSLLEKATKKAMSYLELIDVGAILEGTSTTHGREIWQAEQSLEALEAKSPGCAASVHLKSHIRLAYTAQAHFN